MDLLHSFALVQEVKINIINKGDLLKYKYNEYTPLRHPWKTSWKPPENLWKTSGKPLEKPLENLWKTSGKTSGKPLENLRKTSEKPLENLWKTFEKLPCNLQFLYSLCVTKNDGPKLCDFLTWTQWQQKSPKKVCREKMSGIFVDFLELVLKNLEERYGNIVFLLF